MEYFTEPPKPQLKDVPSFMRKWYKPVPTIDTRWILELFKWAESEYNDTKAYFTITKNFRALEKIKTHNMSSLWIVAHSKEFITIVENMSQELWDSIPKSIQNSLIKVNEIKMGI